MLSILGVILNLVIVAYLGFQLASCLGPEQVSGLNAAQNPLILSFVAVVGLFMTVKS